MATILDAFVITLGLDSSNYKKGQKDNEQDQKKLRDDAEKTGKTFDEQGKKMANSVAAVRDQVIAMIAAFTAGTGIKDFVQQLTAADAALGRASNNLGMSSAQLSTWQGVAERTGGSAQGITASMKSLSQGMVQLALTGQSSALPYFRALGVQIDQFVDRQGNVRDMAGLILSMADAAKAKGLTGAQAQGIFGGMGIDENTINLIMRGRTEIEALFAAQQKYAATQRDTDAAQDRQGGFAVLGSAATELGRTLTTLATPAIVAVTKAITKFVDFLLEHGEFAKALFIGLAAAIGVLTEASAIAAAAFLGITAGVTSLAAAIIAASAAVGLLYDDWKTWTEGGKASFGDFWQYLSEKWAQLVEITRPTIDALKAYWSALWTVIKDGLKFVVDLFSGSSDDIRNDWFALGRDLETAFDRLVDFFKSAAPLILDAIKTAFSTAFDWVEGRAKVVWDAIKGKRGTITGAGSPASNGVSAPISGASHEVGKIVGQTKDDIAYYMSKGWTREQAAGIVANLWRESSGDSSKGGDHGAAYGLAQWHKPRQDAFAKWAGHDIRQSTREEQLAFVDYELRQGTEKGAGSRLSSATSAEQAGDIVSRFYERPADVSGEASQRAALSGVLSKSVDVGAGTAAQANTYNSTGGSTNTSAVEIGTINVNGAGVTDGASFAKTVGGEIRQNNWAGAANTGLTG